MSNRKEGPVTSAEIRKIFTRISPEQSKEDEILQDLEGTVFGQKNALLVISKCLAGIESGITAKDKPLGAILHLGPTGVGKTETINAIAKRWFGDKNKDRLLVINGADYAKEDDKGFIINDFPKTPISHLTGRINPQWLYEVDPDTQKPKRSIIVVRDAHKLHPLASEQVFSPILENGVLPVIGKEGKEELLKFHNTLFFFERNITANDLNFLFHRIGFAPQQFSSLSERNQAIKTGLQKQIPFIKKLTDIALFDNLDRKSGVYGKIFDKFIKERTDSVTKEAGKDISLVIAGDAKDKIIHQVNTALGADDLSMLVDSEIISGFSQLVNTHAMMDSTVYAALDEKGKIAFYREQP